ncbi:MAG: ATP-binding cassette domain-containing protein [Desulfovibrionaceae bacterium]|nr:ATP-binding cassette domain-containing protein [Desulfovibrionaceae bacterium]
MARLIFDLANVMKSRPGAEHYQLRIASFQVLPGETLALVGRSGCGKSTALDLLSCALRPDAAGEKSRFLFSPAEDRKIDIYRAWRSGGGNALASDRMRHLGYVLQTGGLLPFLTAADNITLTCKVLNIVPKRIKAIRQIADRLNITPLLSKYPAQLSVGERQRVAIARALAHNPSVVLADEPTAALDPTHSRLVMKLFLELAREQGSTIIMVSHDQALAGELGFTRVPLNVTATPQGVVSTLFYAGSMRAV